MNSIVLYGILLGLWGATIQKGTSWFSCEGEISTDLIPVNHNKPDISRLERAPLSVAAAYFLMKSISEDSLMLATFIGYLAIFSAGIRAGALSFLAVHLFCTLLGAGAYNLNLAYDRQFERRERP